MVNLAIGAALAASSLNYLAPLRTGVLRSTTGWERRDEPAEVWRARSQRRARGVSGRVPSRRRRLALSPRERRHRLRPPRGEHSRPPPADREDLDPQDPGPGALLARPDQRGWRSGSLDAPLRTDGVRASPEGAPERHGPWWRRPRRAPGRSSSKARPSSREVGCTPSRSLHPA